ncbi:hypothetical protein HD806DRAFT_551548 [Xylariaceae sp. AK1471]|nr:hypothetical protein HD806DRAFT_551548 [Xylariaceae sp. AK1471]
MALQPSLLPQDDTIDYLPHPSGPLIPNGSSFAPVSGPFLSTNVFTPLYLPVRFFCCPFHQNMLSPQGSMPEQMPASWMSVGTPIQQLPETAIALSYDDDSGWPTSAFEAYFQPDSSYSARGWDLPTNNDGHLAIFPPISALYGQHPDIATDFDTQGIQATDDSTSPGNMARPGTPNQQMCPEELALSPVNSAFCTSPGFTQEGIPSPIATQTSIPVTDLEQPPSIPSDKELLDHSTGVQVLTSPKERLTRSLRPGDQEPRCWDHGCNGRRFASRQTLKRHQKRQSKTWRAQYVRGSIRGATRPVIIEGVNRKE